MTDVPATEARYVVVVAAGAATPVQRRLRELLARPELAGRARVLVVLDVADAALRLRLRPDEVPVAAGGDGTANLLAQALRRTVERPLMALLPLGTGNALAHALGVATRARALTALLGGHARPLDSMVTTHPAAPLALASLSAGFEGRFIARYTHWRERGRLLAGAAALAAAGAGREPIRLLADGEELTGGVARVFCAGLYNIPCYAGGRRAWVAADPGDGLGDAVVCPTALGYWRALAAPGRPPARGDPAAPRLRRWSSAVLEAPGPIQFDGEIAAGGTLELRLEPGALHVLVPPG